MVKVIVRDTELKMNYHLKLTEKQYCLLEWINDHGFLDRVEIEIFEECDFKEIGKEY